MRQLSLFPDPLEHECRVEGRGIRSWVGRWLRWTPPPHRPLDGMHEADRHVATATHSPEWCRVLCAPIRVYGRLVAHVRFDGSPVGGTPFGLVLVECDLRSLRPRRGRRPR